MNVREITLKILMETERSEAQSHLLLQDTWRKCPELTSQERRFILRLVQGTLEKRMLLDYRIDQVSKVPVKKMKPAIRHLVRMSAYQIFFMDSIPNSAVCNEAVKLTNRLHMQGLKGFVNGVLRSLTRKEDWKPEPEHIRYSMPEWIYTSWKKMYGNENAARMLEATDTEHVLYFRMLTDEGNPDHASLEMIQECLTGQSIVYRPAPFPEGAWIMENPEHLENLEALKRGWIQIQDISSMMVGTLAYVQENMNVLDVCAAPGGKTLHIAQRLHGTGHITSCDLTEYKVEKIRENIRRSGWKNIEPCCQDARVFRPEWENSMDLVIADLPCSGLGVLGRKPEIRYRVTPNEIRELAALQKEILMNVSRYVKPGGYLLFSTCTVTKEENTDNRDWILKNLPFVAVDFPESRIPEVLRERAAEGYLQLLPGMDPCDGFFISAFRRRD